MLPIDVSPLPPPAPVEISRAVGPLRLGLRVSRVKFPNGFVGSTQPYATITTQGTIGGGYDGYAELIGGFGLQWRTAALPQWALRAEAVVAEPVGLCLVGADRKSRAIFCQ